MKAVKISMKFGDKKKEAIVDSGGESALMFELDSLCVSILVSTKFTWNLGTFQG